jgi:hypothetical protein
MRQGMVLDLPLSPKEEQHLKSRIEFHWCCSMTIVLGEEVQWCVTAEDQVGYKYRESVAVL